jgi:hypothetical protein
VSWARAALCWLAVAVLGLAYLAGPAPPGEAPASGRARPPQPTPVVGDLPSPLRSLEVRRGEEVVSWERANGGWRVTAPAGRAIPAGLLDAFNDQLEAIGFGERFEGDASDPAFGFDRPALRIAVVGDDGESVVLIVGARTPTGTAAYARREDGGPVLLVGLNLLYYADLLFDAAR